MKILVFSLEFPPELGGAGIVARQNAEALNLMGHTVTVLTRKLKEKRPGAGFEIIEPATSSKLWFIDFFKVVDFNQFDIIFLNDRSSIFFAGLFFNDDLMSRSACYLHGSEPEKILLKPSLRKKLVFFPYFYRRALRKCRNIVAVSFFMKSKIIRAAPKLSKLDKLIVAYAGIDFELFNRKVSHVGFKKSLGISDSSDVLVSVSRIVEKKGYKKKLAIFKKLIEQGEDLYWVIAGSGDYLDYLKNEVGKQGLSSRVRFLGAIDRSNLAEIYSASDLFWLLSDYEESFGLVYLEAQACGIPVIGFNNAGVKEAIAPQTGFLIDSLDEAYSIILEKKYKMLSPLDMEKFASSFDVNSQLNRVISEFLPSR